MLVFWSVYSEKQYCAPPQLQLMDICFMTQYPELSYYDITAGPRDCADDASGAGRLLVPANNFAPSLSFVEAVKSIPRRSVPSWATSPCNGVSAFKVEKNILAMGVPECCAAFVSVMYGCCSAVSDVWRA